MKNAFVLLYLLSYVLHANSAEQHFANKTEVLNYYLLKNNHPENVFQVKERNLKLLQIDGKGGEDILIVNPNFSGAHGDGGGVFLCQGNEKDCSDSYYCEANTVVFFLSDMQKKGSQLKCKG